VSESASETAAVVSVNVSERTGVRKAPVGSCEVLVGSGLAGDAHAGDWHRQVSLLAQESIDKMIELGLEVGPGDFAENLTTSGIDLVSLPVGTSLRVGEDVVLEVSQIGKECHTRCAIYYQAGDCVMPKEGIFAVVREGGRVATGDTVRFLETDDDRDGKADGPKERD
jgi:MOSC domain-containing protein YiiM